MTLTRADLTDLDAATVRETALCYGLDCDELTDAEVFAEFADYLDDLEVLAL